MKAGTKYLMIKDIKLNKYFKDMKLKRITMDYS